MKTIQEELGGVSYEAEIEEKRAKGSKKKWDDATAKHFDKELSKLQRTNPNSPDFGIRHQSKSTRPAHRLHRAYRMPAQF